MNITVAGFQISQHQSGKFIGFDGGLYDTPERAAATARPASHRRTARKSPRHKLAAAEPFRQIEGGPTQVVYIPKKLSFWDNNVDGDCVTASEAFRKACANPEIFITDSTVVAWARKYGFLNGANLTDVMDQMAKDGFHQDGHIYGDGPYKSVDYSNEAALQSALCMVGPVNIAIDANALPSGAGNGNGWYAVGGRPGQFPNTDHCVDYCAGGVACTAAWFYAQLGMSVPNGLDPNKVGYGLFTWNSVGFVDYTWNMSTVQEAWVCDPCTMIDGKAVPNPAPTPGPNPPPIPPTPPTNGVVIVSPNGDQLPLPAGWGVLGGSGIPPQLVADIQAATTAEAAANTALQKSDAAWAKVSNDVAQLPKQGTMNKSLLALLLAGGFLVGNVSQNPETNGVAQPPATQKVATKLVPPGCDCNVCDCPDCVGANCGHLIKAAVPPRDLTYDEAYATAMTKGGALAVYKGPWSHSQLKNVASCYVSAADARFAEYPERCVIVSRAEIGDDGAMHLHYVTTVADGKPESIVGAISLPVPRFDRPVVVPATAVRAPIGHTHTCQRCGTTWDHTTNGGHNCPNCGLPQYVQDVSPRMVTARTMTTQPQAAGGCSNGSCNTSARIGFYR